MKRATAKRSTPILACATTLSIGLGCPTAASAQEDLRLWPYGPPVFTPPPPPPLVWPAQPAPEPEQRVEVAPEPRAEPVWQPPPRPGSDPLVPTGITFAALGAVAIAAGAVLRIAGDCPAGSKTECETVGAAPAGAGLMAGGAMAGTVGLVALAMGLDDPMPDGTYRRSQRRMIAGVALTAAGASAAVGGGVALMVDRLGPNPDRGTLFPAAMVLGLGTAVTLTGLPLWGTGARTISVEQLSRENREERKEEAPRGRTTGEPRIVGPGMRNAGICLLAGGAVVGIAGLAMLEAAPNGVGGPVASLGGMTLLAGIPLLAVGQARYGKVVTSNNDATLHVGPTSAFVRGTF